MNHNRHWRFFLRKCYIGLGTAHHTLRYDLCSLFSIINCFVHLMEVTTKSNCNTCTVKCLCHFFHQQLSTKIHLQMYKCFINPTSLHSPFTDSGKIQFPCAPDTQKSDFIYILADIPGVTQVFVYPTPESCSNIHRHRERERERERERHARAHTHSLSRSLSLLPRYLFIPIC
jgi:hypothetical protein